MSPDFSDCSLTEDLQAESKFGDQAPLTTELALDQDTGDKISAFTPYVFGKSAAACSGSDVQENRSRTHM